MARLVEDEGLVSAGLFQEGPRAHNGVSQAASPQRALPATLVRQHLRAGGRRLVVGCRRRARAADQDEVRLLPSRQRLRRNQSVTSLHTVCHLSACVIVLAISRCMKVVKHMMSASGTACKILWSAGPGESGVCVVTVQEGQDDSLHLSATSKSHRLHWRVAWPSEIAKLYMHLTIEGAVKVNCLQRESHLDAVDLELEALGEGVGEDGQPFIAGLHHRRHRLLVLKPAGSQSAFRSNKLVLAWKVEELQGRYSFVGNRESGF